MPCCCMQLWGSLRDFVEQSHVWTEDAILDDDGAVLLNIESIRAAVEEYSQRAYKAGKANKEVRGGARKRLPYRGDFLKLRNLHPQLW